MPIATVFSSFSPDLGSKGFGLQIGNDFYLLLDPPYRRQLDSLKNHLSSSVSVIGTWTADNGTDSNSQVPMSGTFTFSHTMTPIQLNIIDGCRCIETFVYRSSSSPRRCPVGG